MKSSKKKKLAQYLDETIGLNGSVKKRVSPRELGQPAEHLRRVLLS